MVITMLLVGAVMASLAFGVLAAYAICMGMFRLFRVHAISAAKERTQGSSVRVAIEG